MTDTAVFPPRERVMHRMKIRDLHVSQVRSLSESMVRITVSGKDLCDFASLGPADHVKVFFPDAEGTLSTPTITSEGIRRPEVGEVIARDYTPADYRRDALELDLDFVLHEHGGPASNWARNAEVGDVIAVGGPRGSHLAPQWVQDAVIVVDETAFPAAKRWLETLPEGVSTTVLLVAADASVSQYFDEEGLTLSPTRSFQWFFGPDRHSRVEDALRNLEFDEGTFTFLAGEAGLIATLRRYLRRELMLSKQQVDAHGYWKRGVAELDHHAPLDPSDPD